MSMTVSSTFGLASYSVIFGAISFIFTLGGAIGPALAGLIYDSNQSYFWAFIMALALYGLTIPVVLMVRPIATRSNVIDTATN